MSVLTLICLPTSHLSLVPLSAAGEVLWRAQMVHFHLRERERQQGIAWRSVQHSTGSSALCCLFVCACPVIVIRVLGFMWMCAVFLEALVPLRLGLSAVLNESMSVRNGRMPKMVPQVQIQPHLGEIRVRKSIKICVKEKKTDFLRNALFFASYSTEIFR